MRKTVPSETMTVTGTTPRMMAVGQGTLAQAYPPTTSTSPSRAFHHRNVGSALGLRSARISSMTVLRRISTIE